MYVKEVLTIHATKNNYIRAYAIVAFVKLALLLELYSYLAKNINFYKYILRTVRSLTQ
jgi:hypothetical protein